MSGRRGKRIFYYDGKQLEMANPKRDIVIRDPFRPITAMEALCLISVPAAIKTLPDTKVPMTKMIIIRGIVRETPKKVPSTQLEVGEWMITMCRLQVDFQKRQLTMQIPLEDWLLNERNARYQWIQNHDIFRKLDDSVANLTVHVASDREDTRTTEHLKTLDLFKSVANSLGLPDAEMDRIVESVNQVGQ